MKIELPTLLGAAALVLTAVSASAQTLGSAANYDLFLQNGGFLEMSDSNQLFGQIAVSNGATLDGKGESNTFDGTIFKHTGGTIKNASGLDPSEGTQSSVSIDAALDQANADLTSYTSYLQGLAADFTFGNYSGNSFTWTANSDLTVLDFSTLSMQNHDFTLNGSSSDVFVIRTSGLTFSASDVILNGVSSDNVIWYHRGTSNFDLHKSASNPADFMKFAGTIIAPNGQVILGEADFTGRVFGSNLKLGSGFEFTGTAIPEPTSGLMLLSGIGVLLLVRRRSR